MPYTSDEPTRGIVAFEMMNSGNYVTPSIKGEFYYNKPPLYNWILIIFFKVFGISEFTLRLPAILSLYGFLASIFYFARKHFGSKQAIVITVLFLTCGRILFWDSMLGLIDIFFSWMTFLSFMYIIEGIQKERYYKAFLLSYLLGAAGFLMKGLPSIAFQGITIFIVLLAEKKLRKLFSIQHFAGIGLFVLLIGGYFLIYSQYNQIESFFDTLWEQSSKRTPLEHGILGSVQHMLTFHFENIYHFIPWTLLIILFIRKDIISILKSNRFIWLVTIVFVANLLIYWFSPSTIPRYLLMLVPLSFFTLYYVYNKNLGSRAITMQITETIFRILIPLAAIVLFFAIFLSFNAENSGTISEWTLLGLIIIGFSLFFALPKRKEQILLAAAAMILLLRIGYNIYYLPQRVAEMWELEIKEKVEEIAPQTTDKELYILGKSNVDHNAVLYFESIRNKTLAIEKGSPKENTYYIATQKVIKENDLISDDYTVHHEFFMKHKNIPLYIITLNSDSE